MAAMMDVRLYRYWLAQPEQTDALQKERINVGLPWHARPGSTLVAAMGSYWRPGCLEAITAMCEMMARSGFEVGLYELPDRCLESHDALGSMRNEAIRAARSQGYEFLCYVDNDVQPPADALVKLLRHFLPVVAPVLHYPTGETFGLVTPDLEKMPRDRGLVMGKNILLSMFLCRVNIFNPFIGGDFWQDAIGADEDYHWAKLYDATGVLPFLDTGVDILVMDPPHFPLKDAVEERRQVHAASMRNVVALR